MNNYILIKDAGFVSLREDVYFLHFKSLKLNFEKIYHTYHETDSGKSRLIDILNIIIKENDNIKIYSILVYSRDIFNVYFNEYFSYDNLMLLKWKYL